MAIDAGRGAAIVRRPVRRAAGRWCGLPRADGGASRGRAAGRRSNGNEVARRSCGSRRSAVSRRARRGGRGRGSTAHTRSMSPPHRGSRKQRARTVGPAISDGRWRAGGPVRRLTRRASIVRAIREDPSRRTTPSAPVVHRPDVARRETGTSRRGGRLVHRHSGRESRERLSARSGGWSACRARGSTDRRSSRKTPPAPARRRSPWRPRCGCG